MESGVRRRTESTGCSSDSDLSDGWNFLDHSDVNNTDVPSSDGESVEVIEGEDETLEHVAAEGGESLPLVARPACPLVSTSDTEAESPYVALSPPRPVQEEMFDTSFCWFLFFAVSAVLVSNLAIMAADNVLDWNVNVNVDAPSFLRDLPTTPKSSHQNNFPTKISWAVKEEQEMVVDSVDETVADEQGEEEISYKRPERLMDAEIKYKRPNVKSQKHVLNINKHEVEKYFKALSDVAGSAKAENKFAQTLLILDALQVGLKDLEEVVTEHSELHELLKKQKEKLVDVLNEVEFGVSRSMERLATNVLNKVQNLERKFENQWCSLQKRGLEHLKGLFYDCQPNEDVREYNDKSSSESVKEKEHEYKQKDKRFIGKKQITIDQYHYQVDKDSTGKVYSKPDNVHIVSENYDKWVKNGKYGSAKYNKNHRNKKIDIQMDKENEFTKDKIYGENKNLNNNDDHSYQTRNENPTAENPPEKRHQEYSEKLITIERSERKSYQKKHDKYSVSKSENGEHKQKVESRANYNPESKDFHSSYLKTTTDKSENREYQTKKEKPVINESENRGYHKNHRKPTIDRLVVEKLSKYLKENCQKNIRNHKMTRAADDYYKLKDNIGEHMRFSKELFDTMFEKYCKFNRDNFKWDNKFKNDHLKGDYNGKNNDKRNTVKDEPVIIEDAKDGVEFTVVDLSEENNKEGEQSDSVKDKVIEPANKARSWIFSYEGPISNNKSNISGEWFIRAGESRSKARWSNHRSDWWFDRASHRRSSPQPTWHFNRRKNWFFRRAWARQQCRQSPHNGWCDLHGETVTIPNASSNFR